MTRSMWCSMRKTVRPKFSRGRAQSATPCPAYGPPLPGLGQGACVRPRPRTDEAMTSHPSTPPARQTAGLADDPQGMAATELRTLAQAAIGRSILQILEDPPQDTIALGELREDLALVHRVMAAAYADQPRTVEVHELAVRLVKGEL